ncbi:hypothetical protein EUTSA_v10003670mg [Eutrema salsugineum]|uniref:C2H2-type domain-containing protein n=1 Tax=Eutrema salsugineum TaxID=72664 RepID=V4KKS1_EUTSA|nr:uncharacterized protein LOC18011998 [Eutrema salsugineum]ESQ31819.1 hypothetical protein EUTSA_v10003670mg [Eutrema salsugineum]
MSNAEAEYARAKTSVWWDIENCPVPNGFDAHGIAQKFSSALNTMNYCGPLSISSYGNTSLIPNSVQLAISSSGISLNHVPSGKKDASDKKILVDMFMWVMENPAPANIMLISGDGDFSDALHRLRMKRYNILLVHPQQVSASLVASAKTTWLWKSFLVSGAPLTQLWRSLLASGASLTQCEYSRLFDDSQIPSQDAPNQLLQQETRRKKLQKNCRETCESTWFCKICNVACKSFEIFTLHLSGKEHAAQWKLKQNLELLGEPQNMAAAPSKCHEKDVQMTNKVVEARVEASAHCSSCSVVCPTQASLDSHPKSAAMLKKQAEALVDVKNIEEVVQDNDLQSRDAQESMKYLEKQNRELMESCTASERSGKEFWQDFKERLESEERAPLNVACVFSELSRDFRVPKELRVWFEGILNKLEPLQNGKLEGMLKVGLNMKPGELENSLARPTEHLEDMNTKKKRKKSKKQKTEDGAEPYVCSLCSVICDWPADLESHLKGRKHTNMVKRHAEGLLDDMKIQEEMIQDNGHPTEMIEELRIQPGEALENVNCLENKNKELRERCATSERNVEENCQTFEEVLENENKPLPNAKSIFAKLNPEFSAPEEAREWVGGIIKKLELPRDANLTRELSIPNQNHLEMNSGDPESNPEGATEHLKEYMVKKGKDNVNKDGAEPEVYVCSICNVICVHPIVFESHLMGKKHAKSVKRHAEVLFDDKKILEENLKEKDHPRDVLEELRYQPKEAQENTKEVCQSTKGGVDIESKVVPIGAFPEPKEAR